MARDSTSSDSLTAATRGRAKFSGHGTAKGAAGVRGDASEGEFLSKPEETAIVNPPAEGFGTIRIAAAWDNIVAEKGGFFSRLLNRAQHKGVDLDLGCLYELENGKRGAIQAFGDMYGSFDEEPWIQLSEDDRTGDGDEDDEILFIRGDKWPVFKRLLFYVYIYDGVPDWAAIKPRIEVDVPGEPPLVVSPHIHDSALAVCVIAGMEHVRGGIKLINYTEYYPGHAEMDRAFGFGLQWDDGEKI